MSKPFLIAFGSALGIALALAAWWGTASRVEAGGKIGKVRVQKVDDNESIAIFDFSVQNSTSRPRSVSAVTAHIETPDGSRIDGHTLGAADMANVLRNFPALGPQYNDPLKAMDTIAPGQAVDREVGVRFDASDAAVSGRKEIVLGIEYINGPLVELKAK